MSIKIKVLIGFVCGVLVTIAIPLIVLAAGVMDWGATAKPSSLETGLAGWALERSMASRAPQQTNPFANQPAALATGLTHYRENCVICHGAPGVERSEAGKGLNPEAPSLVIGDVQGMSDGQLFWITKHGIRMTGMPAFGVTHKDDEIWQIVSFVRHLPQLTPEEQRLLGGATKEEGDHHHEH